MFLLIVAFVLIAFLWEVRDYFYFDVARDCRKTPGSMPVVKNGFNLSWLNEGLRKI